MFSGKQMNEAQTSLPTLFDGRTPSLWHRLLPGRMKRKQYVSNPVTSVILRSSNNKPDSERREVYRSLSDLPTDTPPVSPTGNGYRKSGERRYRSSFTSTPHLNTNHHYKHLKRNFSQNPRISNGCSNGIEPESTSTQPASINKSQNKNTEKKKKMSIFRRLLSRKDKRTAQSEQITSTSKNKDQSASNLTQIKQPHLRSNILTSCAADGLKNANYSGHVGPPRRFMSDMNLYVPKSMKNLSTSAALEGQIIDESFSFLADENIFMVSSSNHRIANGEFVLSQKAFSTGFASEFSLPDAKYSPQQSANHYYDNNFHSGKMRESQNSGTSYEEVENEAESPELAVLRHQLNLRKVGLSKPNLHVKSSLTSGGLMRKSSEDRDNKDVLY